MSGKVKVTYQSSSSEASADEDGSDIDNQTNSEIEEEDNNIEEVDNNIDEEDTNIEEEDSEIEGDTEDNDGDNTEQSNPLSNVMANILKQKTTSKSTILAKGKTEYQILKSKRKKEESEEEGEDETSDSKPVKQKKVEVDEDTDSDSDIGGDEQKMKRRKWEYMGRLKPNILHKDKERRLQKITTRGVVQLFNAVKQQQKELGESLSKVSSERGKDKVRKSIDKGKFLDVLKKGTQALKEDSVPSKTKEEPSWSILKDNFMMGAKMKDWDKDSDMESGVESA